MSAFSVRESVFLAATLVVSCCLVLAARASDDKEFVGKIKEVSAAKKYFVIELAEKQERRFQVNRETKFTGPRGADREDRLSDPCMAVGYEVRVTVAADDQVAKEVKLAVRKLDEEKKKGKKGG
jgi:hypothetical protein